MRFIFFLAVVSSCAANAERGPEDRRPVERELAPEPTTTEGPTAIAPTEEVAEPGPHATPGLPEPEKPAKPAWGCEVATDSADVRKHLGLDHMGPTGSDVRLPRGPGFVRFDGDGDVYYAGYICETWSADSDECDGSVVQVVELAAISGESPEVIWRSGPQLGSGGDCGSAEANGTFRDLAIEDYDGDGQPDLRFSKTTNPARATVRLFDGTRYDAWLPESAIADPEFDLCRPTPGLAYSVQKSDESKATPTTEVPPKVKAALAAAYLPSAECPDAE